MLGDRIRKLRETAKETQPELAELLSVTKQTVSAWEKGRSTPSIHLLCEIAHHYGCSTDYLLDMDTPANFSEAANLTDTQKYLLAGLSRELEELNRKSGKIHILSNKHPGILSQPPRTAG